jgi:putative aldouronate transport system substrate-binding protein
VDGVKAVERTEQGTNNWSMDGFVTGSVVNASVTSNAIYDWEKIYADYDKALLSTLGAFSFNKEDVEAECAACSAVMAKYNAELYTGTLDIDEMLPTIKEELEKAGIFDIQKEAQRQLDEYLGK